MHSEQNNRQATDDIARAVIGKLIPNRQIKPFAELKYSQDFLDYLGQQILSYLDINAIIVFARMNKNSWYPKSIIHPIILKELQHRNRKRRVTIYSWVAGASSLQTNSNLDLGHSALRTWSGGENDKGIYVSFYPNHTRKNDNSPQACQKLVSHFHSLAQESVQGIGPVDLYGLDVEAINQAFRSLHDANMNSNKPWSTRYNCSDVVLFLLEKGGLFEKIRFNPLGTISIILNSAVDPIPHLFFFKRLPEILFEAGHVSTRLWQ